MVLFWYSHSVLAADFEKETTESLVKQDNENQHKPANNSTVQPPDKEFLLFLSEFSDARGDWIDPEVFNQPYTETKDSTIEFEETKK